MLSEVDIFDVEPCLPPSGSRSSSDCPPYVACSIRSSAHASRRMRATICLKEVHVKWLLASWLPGFMPRSPEGARCPVLDPRPFQAGGRTTASNDIGDITTWNVPTGGLNFPASVPGVLYHHWKAAVTPTSSIAQHSPSPRPAAAVPLCEAGGL